MEEIALLKKMTSDSQHFLSSNDRWAVKKELEEVNGRLDHPLPVSYVLLVYVVREVEGWKVEVGLNDLLKLKLERV